MSNEITLDLTNYKDRVGQRILPGRYRVVVDDVEQTTAASGNTMINIWLRIMDGEFAGARIIDRLVLTEKSLFRVVGFMPVDIRSADKGGRGYGAAGPDFVRETTGIDTREHTDVLADLDLASLRVTTQEHTGAGSEHWVFRAALRRHWHADVSTTAARGSAREVLFTDFDARPTYRVDCHVSGLIPSRVSCRS